MRVVIDSREVAFGDLFVGLPGEQVDGGAYAEQALEAGAWGALVARRHAEGLSQGVVLAHEDPLEGLQRLAKEWLKVLKEEGARVIGITGSTGKTSTKDILKALLEGHRRIVASAENRNTEIGLPLTILEAPAGTEVLVLEMAMRGPGQIAELAEIARPDVGVIVNVGPVHLEQLGSLEGVAAAKAELIAGLAPGGTAVVPADEPLLEPYRREDVRTVTFGPGGDVAVSGRREVGEVGGAGDVVEVGGVGGDGAMEVAVVDHSGERPVEIALRVGFEQEHQLRNLEAAVAAARAVGVTPAGEVRVRFSRMRGQRRGLPGGVEVIEDCYNANPMSVRAAIDELASLRQKRARAQTRAQTHTHTRARTHAHTHAHARAIAVLGDMLELGPEETRYHREVGEYAATRGVDVLVTVGPRAAEMAGPFAAAAAAAQSAGQAQGAVRGREVYAAADAQVAGGLLAELVAEGDTVLVKGSRGVGLERAIEVLAERLAPATRGSAAATTAGQAPVAAGG